MAVAQPTVRLQRYAFWTTGLLLCGLWQVGTLAGALAGEVVDPTVLGLDAAGPAVFLALLAAYVFAWVDFRGRSLLFVARKTGMITEGIVMTKELMK